MAIIFFLASGEPPDSVEITGLSAFSTGAGKIEGRLLELTDFRGAAAGRGGGVA